MKKVLIFPSDDRLGLASMIDHYNKANFEVYVPKYGSFGLNWSKLARWPALLCKDKNSKLNLLDNPVLSTDPIMFGEDWFLTNEEVISYYVQKDTTHLPTCILIDEVEAKNIKIDMYHSLRGSDNYHSEYKKIIKEYFPNATWTSSAICPYISLEKFKYKENQPNLLTKIIPASYENFNYNNCMNIFCTDVEFRLHHHSQQNIFDRKPIAASFNHNYHVRYPDDFKLFEGMNEVLKSKNLQQVKNYGGNIRGMGADVRYSGGGPTGNYDTLSPLENTIKFCEISAVVHFKSADYGGGVFFHALHSSTPMITTQKYVNVTNSHKYLVHGKNCIIVNDERSAAVAVELLYHDKNIRGKLINGMFELKNKLTSEDYWDNWKTFINTLQSYKT